MTLQLSKGSQPNPSASQGFPRWGGWLVVFLPPSLSLCSGAARDLLAAAGIAGSLQKSYRYCSGGGGGRVERWGGAEQR